MNDWGIYKSGECTDSNGWFYATTLEGLTESYNARTTSGTKSATSIVRRRRWTRARICVSDKVRCDILATIESLNNSKEEIDKTLRRKQQDFAVLRTFEKIRKNSYFDMANQSNMTIQGFVTILRDFRDRYSKYIFISYHLNVIAILHIHS